MASDLEANRTSIARRKARIMQLKNALSLFGSNRSGTTQAWNEITLLEAEVQSMEQWESDYLAAVAQTRAREQEAKSKASVAESYSRPKPLIIKDARRKAVALALQAQPKLSLPRLLNLLDKREIAPLSSWVKRTDRRTWEGNYDCSETRNLVEQYISKTRAMINGAVQFRT